MNREAASCFVLHPHYECCFSYCNAGTVPDELVPAGTVRIFWDSAIIILKTFESGTSLTCSRKGSSRGCWSTQDSHFRLWRDTCRVQERPISEIRYPDSVRDPAVPACPGHGIIPSKGQDHEDEDDVYDRELGRPVAKERKWSLAQAVFQGWFAAVVEGYCAVQAVRWEKSALLVFMQLEQYYSWPIQE